MSGIEISTETQSEIDQVWAAWLALTHEDIKERGYGCAACYTQTTCSWWRGTGDIYCFTCALSMEIELGETFTQVETREQRATWEAWSAQGIGAN